MVASDWAGLGFKDLLVAAGIDPRLVKVLRHETFSSGRTPYILWKTQEPEFQVYQSHQSVSRRSDLRYPIWASFVVPPNRETLFVGLYAASLVGPLPDRTICPLEQTERFGESSDLYRLEPLVALSDLVGRLVIDWNAGTRQWIQYASRHRPVQEIRSKSYEPQFPGYLELTENLSELEALPATWRGLLSAASGVYLLTCPKTGEHYVGAAYGSGGFLGRWRGYFGGGHGGNVGLKGRESDYQVTILEVAGSRDSHHDIVKMEDRWKRKLQSRSMGLNRN
ncbi:GIY-YIG nuclease family protein [Rhizorhabdus sp.]|uniref:GIY-YIG nuclease family protein n=1 Tax=Rhizorhabdus sp. TaxID=1968843 RepID=UPI0019983BA0|nr:GIY-YIG nuclease family protein [Rhizorhabdus sp.]MBD3761433.1 GIY-YIG nuclease family protein [Rhizorhabdus sp.]